MALVPEASLTPDEHACLAQQEAIIARGLQTFWEVGQALATIRDQRLYRATHATFAAYLQQRWKLSRVYAHRLIEAAAVRERLLPIGNNPPDHEAQVRPLTRLKDPDARRQVWQQVTDQATAQGQPITGSLVQTAVTQHPAASPPPPLPDRPAPMTEPQSVSECEQLVLARARQYGRAGEDEQLEAAGLLLRAARQLVKREGKLGKPSR